MPVCCTRLHAISIIPAVIISYMKTYIRVEVGKEDGKLITTVCAYAPYRLDAFSQSTKIIVRIKCVLQLQGMYAIAL